MESKRSSILGLWIEDFKSTHSTVLRRAEAKKRAIERQEQLRKEEAAREAQERLLREERERDAARQEKLRRKLARQQELAAQQVCSHIISRSKSAALFR